jgi:hypothetical protein
MTNPRTGASDERPPVRCHRASATTYGICRHVKQFRSAPLTRVAGEIETELGDAFRPHGARLRVVPIRISHLTAVGEGIALELDPDDVASWDWWGDFESDIEVSRRGRFSRTWEDRLSSDDVRTWLREEAKSSLARLDAA